MTFGQWYVRRGRIGRETWLATIVPPSLLVPFALLADDVVRRRVDLPAWLHGAVGPVTLLLLAVAAVPVVTALACRLHDRGRPAWWLLAVPVPVLGLVAVGIPATFLRGDAGPNRYGPPPEAA